MALNQVASAPRAGAVLLATSPGIGDDALLWSPLAGRPLLAWSLNALRGAREIGPVTLVVSQSRLEVAARMIATEGYSDTRALALPPGAPLAAALDLIRADLTSRLAEGETGLAATARKEMTPLRTRVRRMPAGREVMSPRVIVLHDAARPFVQDDHLAALIVAAAETGVAVSAEPVKETIKRVTEGRVVETLPRDELALLITPLAIRTDVLPELAAAPDRPAPAGIMGYVAAALALGVAVRSVANMGVSLTVTSPQDLGIADMLLRRTTGGTSE